MASKRRVTSARLQCECNQGIRNGMRIENFGESPEGDEFAFAIVYDFHCPVCEKPCKVTHTEDAQ